MLYHASRASSMAHIICFQTFQPVQQRLIEFFEKYFILSLSLSYFLNFFYLAAFNFEINLRLDFVSNIGLSHTKLVLLC